MHRRTAAVSGDGEQDVDKDSSERSDADRGEKPSSKSLHINGKLDELQVIKRFFRGNRYLLIKRLL